MVDDRGVDEVVVWNDHQVFFMGQHLRRKNTNRHNGSNFIVDFNSIPNFKRLVKRQHKRVDDVAKRLLHGKTDDQ